MTIGGEIIVANKIRPRPPGERSIVSRIVDRVRGMIMTGSSFAAPWLAAGSGWSDPRWWTNDLDDLPTAVTEITALGIPPFGRGVELIASTIAGVDLVAHRYDTAKEIDVRIPNQPPVLVDPDPMQPAWNWKYAVVNDLIMFGNHFSFLGSFNAEGWPTSLIPIDIEQIGYGIDRDESSPTFGMVFWTVGGQTYRYGDLFHISAGNRSGHLFGRGVIQQYRDALSGVLATEEHAGRYFRRGGLPSAVISVDNPELSQQTAEEIKDAYERAMSGGRRRPLVIPKIYEFTPVVSDAEKQQLVEARTWDANTVAIMLGLPAHLLNLPGTSMTYQNIEQADIGFVRDTVDRWAKPIEGGASKWLLPYGQTARFNWSQRMRTDAKSRAEVDQIDLNSGVITIDEARKARDLPPLPPKPEPVIPPALAPFVGQPPTEDDQQQDQDTEAIEA